MLASILPAGPARYALLAIGVGLASLLLAVACGQTSGTAPSGAVQPSGQPAGDGAGLTMYLTPTCGCCGQYAAYLNDQGFDVELVYKDDLAPMKDSLGIPEDMRSCHTITVGDFYVEGHVPAQAIRKLLEEQPAVDGIALPGMPAGSPGMGGQKEGPFVVYAITNGHAEEFMVV